MNSMTGFGAVSRRSDSGVAFAAEISSVNRKSLEIRASLPKEILSWEPLLRQIVSRRISRGYVTARVNISFDEKAAAGRAGINEDLVSAYLGKIKAAQERFNVPGRIEMKDLLSLPGVIEEGISGNLLSGLEEVFSKTLGDALDKLSAMRAQEGRQIAEDLAERISRLEALALKIDAFAEKLPEIQRNLLLKRLKESGLECDAGDERVLKELVIFADRSDVSEEILRLKSHFKQFRSFLAGADPSGRSLDFLVQELHREITTVGNKALSADVSPLVVSFKTELEKIREQIQNVE